MFIVFCKVKILYTLYIYDLLHILVSLSHSYGSMEYLCVCMSVNKYIITYMYTYICTTNFNATSQLCQFLE